MEAAGESHGCSYGSRTDSFLRRITSRRSRSFQQLLLMEAVGGVSVFKRNNGRNDDDDDNNDNDISLPGYEYLTQSMRSPEDSDPIDRNKQKQQKQKKKQKQMQVQKLMQYVFARRGGAEGDDDDVKAVAKMKEEKKKKRNKETKKKKSWLPDPEKRWPIQGWGVNK